MGQDKQPYKKSTLLKREYLRCFVILSEIPHTVEKRKHLEVQGSGQNVQGQLEDSKKGKTG